MNILPRTFYTRDTHTVAKELLGNVIVRTYNDKQYVARITDVECYVGENDKASHASKGKTKRNAVMFGEAGFSYVYLIYGMYNCLNVVTEMKDYPAAILIRGAIPIKEFEAETKLDGPGKLCREMHITREQNALDITKRGQLYIADDEFRIPRGDIQSSPRVNVDYAGKDALLPWRYTIQNG